MEMSNQPKYSQGLLDSLKAKTGNRRPIAFVDDEGNITPVPETHPTMSVQAPLVDWPSHLTPIFTDEEMQAALQFSAQQSRDAVRTPVQTFEEANETLSAKRVEESELLDIEEVFGDLVRGH